MDTSQKINTLLCPECDTTISVSKDVKIGDIFECPACGTESELVDLTPFKLSPLEEEK